MPKQSLIRIGFLLTLLIGEAALVVSLRSLGWHETGGAIRWISSLLLAVLPLAIAAILLAGHRFRFGLRTLLVAMALVALFFAATVMPLQEAMDSRNMSRRLLAAGATLRTNSSSDDYYERLGYELPPSSSLSAADGELAVWLRPLAGNLLATPADEAVKDVRFNSDEQIFLLCHEPYTLRNLQRITVYGDVTPAGMEVLRRSLQEFPCLTDIDVGVDVPKDWFRALEGIRWVYLWPESHRAPRRLSTEHLHDIAALPDLRVLRIHEYAINDADLEVLSHCESLKSLILRNTAVTEVGERQLSGALPGCVVDRQ